MRIARPNLRLRSFHSLHRLQPVQARNYERRFGEWGQSPYVSLASAST